MHLAVGSSLAIVVVTSIRSYVAHKRHNAVDQDLLRGWLVAVPAGALLASAAAAYMSSGMLRGVFAFVCVLIAIKLLVGRDDWRLGKDLPSNPLRALVGAAIGFLSTLMGIGGGILNNTFMTAYGRPIHQAVATSAGIGMLIAIPGFLGYIWAGWGQAGLPPFSTGFVNWLAVGCLFLCLYWSRLMVSGLRMPCRGGVWNCCSGPIWFLSPRGLAGAFSSHAALTGRARPKSRKAC